MKHFKAMITITLRKSILDVQGKTVEHALHSTNFTTIEHVRIGKYVELTVHAEHAEAALSIVDDACKNIIANPIMEDHHIVLEEISIGEPA
ncbi:MAG: phosphoribosylformylglycinamidine synthase subunit PurS [Bacteroidetes bacterium]|nr:phosphoribosylformylglycinamidine synthase subunit PurS [bacterium]NBP63206.1 phosphoribosylformylglycinamidine synthase subunit PurS [Bacteroidota bacterium]